MTDPDEPSAKVHYICQTYVEKSAGRSGQAVLQIGKQFQYTTAEQAQERADRECRAPGCVGADAYMVDEDPNSGEVSAPVFLARFGTVPEFEAF
tara:strand:+ start:1179 stop:1460 length:282 start_codon:yes stop_codon:yes gene_type:complete